MATQLTIRIPDDLEAALEASVRRSGLNRSDVVRAALREFLQGESLEHRPIELVRDLIGKARIVPSSGEDRRLLVERIRKHAVRTS